MVIECDAQLQVMATFILNNWSFLKNKIIVERFCDTKNLYPIGISDKSNKNILSTKTN